MDVKELLDLMRKEKATPERVEAFKKRQKEREEIFAKRADEMKPDRDWYNRGYDI